MEGSYFFDETKEEETWKDVVEIKGKIYLGTRHYGRCWNRCITTNIGREILR
jgi:hypothetical protein